MSDNKRVVLTTFEPQNVSEKKNKKTVKSIRICVILPESNEDKCPEYNYKDELAAVKKRSKQKDVKEPNHLPNGLDPFDEENDDDVRRIAMQMEEKYGTGGGGGSTKKKRKGRKDDYADIGMGYDESDSFIDNTDGYDEIIPQNVTTLHGGFYINCGALEFKTDDEATSDFSSSSSESDDDDEVGEKSTVNRKRILETSDEDDNEGKESNDAKKQKIATSSSVQHAIKKKLFSQNKIQVKKRRPIIDPLKKTVKELLREKRQDLNMSVPEELVVDVEASEKDCHKENKKPMSISSVTDAIESVVKANLLNKAGEVVNTNGNSKPVEMTSREVTTTVTKVDQVSSTVDGESSHDSSRTEREVKLPENLPADILEVINSIKKAASEHKDGKVKFFNEEVNAMLLNLERKCRCLGKSSRTKVYEHLSIYVGCKKDTLVRRAKNLVLEEEERTLKKMLENMKRGINEIMPALLANHEKESQKILQRKFSAESLSNEEPKSLRMPHRKFQWTDEMRKLLKDIVSTKKRCYLLEGKTKDNFDELIMLYLKSDIQPLWPEGWMSVAALRKACNIDPRKSDEMKSTSNKSLDSKANSSLTKQPDSKPSNHGNNVMKHSLKSPASLALSNSNLQIIPVTNNSAKTVTAAKSNEQNEFTVSKVTSSMMKHSQKSQEKTLSIIPSFPTEPEPPPPRKEKEETRFYDFSKSIKLPETSIQSVPDSVIVSAQKSREEALNFAEDRKKKETNAVIIESKHCQVIDLTEGLPKRKPGPKSKTMKPSDYHGSSKPSEFLPKSIKTANDTQITPLDFSNEPKKLLKQPAELSVTSTYHPAPTPMEYSNVRSEGDDIQKVMEDLLALQKLSSPSKSASEHSSSSNPVSVIAYNKNFSPKNTSSNHSRTDVKQSDFTTSYQDEFQKQFINSLAHMSTPTSSKNNFNRCS